MTVFASGWALLGFTERLGDWFAVHPLYRLCYDILYKSTILLFANGDSFLEQKPIMIDDKPSRIHSQEVSECIKSDRTIQEWEAVSSEKRTATEASSRWWSIFLSIRFLPAQAFEHRHIETTYWLLNSYLPKVASAGPFPWIQSWF